MTKMRLAKNEQKNILDELKKLTYKEILNVDNLDHYVKADLKGTIKISKNLGCCEEICVSVTVDAGTDLDYVSIFPEVNTGEIYCEYSAFVDGFDIFPDGKIKLMHPKDNDIE